jgi:hypothetical protein
VVSGTVNVSRDLWDDTAFANGPFSEREAWIWMIAEASWKARMKRVGDYVVSLDRGQLAHSTRFLAETWGWTHSKARRYLERLEKMNLIAREIGTGVSVITICKYDKYQHTPQASGTPSAQVRHRSGTNENKGEIRVKEEEETNVSSLPRKRASRLSQDWALPLDWGEWAISEGWSEPVIRLEADKFRDYWISKSGRDGTKADWQATWRNWMRNSKSPKAQNGGGYVGTSKGTDRLRAFVGGAD